MYTKQPKKLLILNILDLLRKYTDDTHSLNQKEIIEILDKEYQMPVDRKAVRRNLLDLIDAGYEIGYRENIKNVPVKDHATGKTTLEEQAILSDFHYKHSFTESEIRLLIDSLLFSPHINFKQRRELIEKLEGLESKYFKSKMKHVREVYDEKEQNQELFLNIEILDEAINKNRKVCFYYLEYDIDKKLRCKKDATGNKKEYVVTPYQMAAKTGKYYLICNYDKYDDISNYRLDRIYGARILQEKGKPFRELKCSGSQNLNLEEYMKQHVYMYSGENVRARLKTVTAMVSDVIDMFGSDVRFRKADDTHVTALVYANERAIMQFAWNFAPDVIVMEPEELRNKVKSNLEQAAKAYGKEEK